jgi:hypothetical protein
MSPAYEIQHVSQVRRMRTMRTMRPPDRIVTSTHNPIILPSHLPSTRHSIEFRLAQVLFCLAPPLQTMPWQGGTPPIKPLHRQIRSAQARHRITINLGRGRPIAIPDLRNCCTKLLWFCLDGRLVGLAGAKRLVLSDRWAERGLGGRLHTQY